ncbi:g4025 [Coccomyxa elongata]
MYFRRLSQLAGAAVTHKDVINRWSTSHILSFARFTVSATLSFALQGPSVCLVVARGCRHLGCHRKAVCDVPNG